MSAKFATVDRRLAQATDEIDEILHTAPRRSLPGCQGGSIRREGHCEASCFSHNMCTN